MERITYRITLDAHKNGIQRTLQGFETSDKMSRRIAANIMANGDTYEIPSGVTAVMYITTPEATEPSINECVIEDNTVIYDMLPITEEGVTEMQIKLIEEGVKGAKSVLLSARFAVEVAKSVSDDGSAVQTTTFTALENAIAKAGAVYNARLLEIDISEDFVFRAYYADGSIYENDALNKALYNGNAKLSESWAVGGTGTREGEDTDNSKYYSNVSQSASADASNTAKNAQMLLDDALKRSVYTVFSVDYETGKLLYLSDNYGFDINGESGQLEVDGGENYTPEDLIGESVDQFIDQKAAEIDAGVEEAKNIAKGKNQARVFDTTEDMTAWLSDEANKGVCSIGDNIYIRALDVPDWWVSEVLESADAETGMYYEISQLESQSVDIAQYENYLNGRMAAGITVRYNAENDMIQVLANGGWVNAYKAYANVTNLTKLTANDWTKSDIASVEMTNEYLRTEFEYGTVTATNRDGYIYTNNLYDFSKYSTVKMKADIYGWAATQGTNTLKIEVVDESGEVVKTLYSYTTDKNATQNTFEATLDEGADVSDLNGFYRIRLYGSVFGNWKIAAKFTEFYLS